MPDLNEDSALHREMTEALRTDMKEAPGWAPEGAGYALQTGNTRMHVSIEHEQVKCVVETPGGTVSTTGPDPQHAFRLAAQEIAQKPAILQETAPETTGLRF